MRTASFFSYGSFAVTSRRAFVLAASFALLTAAISLGATSVAQESPPAGNVAPDLASMDRLLATVKPGQELVTFGDMMVAPSVLQAWRDQLIALSSPTKTAGGPRPNSVSPPAENAGGPWPRWAGGDVYYKFDPAQVADNTLDSTRRQLFRDSVAEWASCAKLRFIEVTGTPPSRYIKVQHDPNRYGGIFIYGNGFGEAAVQYGPSDWLNRRVLCHEVGHALGLYHEQQRLDRDSYITIFWENLPPNQGSWTMVPSDSVHRGPYDFYSVMHYSRNIFAPDPNEDTMHPLPAYAPFLNVMGYDRTGETRTLSRLDREGMAGIYGLPTTAPTNVVTNTKDSGAGSLRAALVYAFDRSTNNPSQPTTIIFQIPASDPGFDGKVFTIKPTYGLFAPGNDTTIDGGSQRAFTGDTNPAGPEIVINGSAIPTGLPVSGVTLLEANCTVRELVINGFNEHGIRIAGTGAAGNVVVGCYIGTDATGTTAVPNGVAGIGISGGANANTIGGIYPADRNVIAGNSGAGISIGGAGSTGNVVVGNLIGLAGSGTAVVGNGGSGVQIELGAASNTIGGTDPAARNFISGNANYGIVISGTDTDSNVVCGNSIGLNVDNAQAGNGTQGIAILDGAQGNVIGGIASGAGNIIRHNNHDGVAMAHVNTFGNAVNQNSIFQNGGRGIVLYESANNQQAFPNLSSAVLGNPGNPAGIDIMGTLISAPNTTYRIEFLSNSVADPSGFGEGELFIGSTNVTTSAVGSVAFTAHLAAAVQAGQIVTSKATDAIGNTSEFSSNLVVTTTDTDNDGMPDAFEDAYGFHKNNASDAAIDSDGDGMTNLQEFRAGTNPKNAQSRLSMSAVAVTGGTPQISFQPVAGKSYRLEYSDSLLPSNWRFLSTIFAPSSSPIQISDNSAAGRSKRFYRAVVQQ